VSIQAKRQDRFLGETRLLDLQLAALVMVATRMAAIDRGCVKTCFLTRLRVQFSLT
jgi:hypothetical protein